MSPVGLHHFPGETLLRKELFRLKFFSGKNLAIAQALMREPVWWLM
jgi:hypothetical protein